MYLFVFLVMRYVSVLVLLTKYKDTRKNHFIAKRWHNLIWLKFINVQKKMRSITFDINSYFSTVIRH